MRRLGPDHLPIEDPGIRPVSPGHDAWAYLSLKFVIWHQRGSYAYALLRRADATKVRL